MQSLKRHPNDRRQSRPALPPRRRGFTLVEMMVAVTLVLLMMSMFAQVFQVAGSSISKQRGLAENDQRSRSVQTILKADLDKRTFRWVYPFAAGEDPNASESNITKRQGYFYISENNPADSLDDVLQFTMISTMTVRNTDDTPYYGQALNLGGFANYPNQPDADDAQLVSNNTGQSVAVEVSYFVRNGNLYRRQLLLRQPLSSISARTQPDDSNISGTTGTPLFKPSYSGLPGYASQYSNNNGLGTFWGDFDYSAAFGGVSNGALFLGVDALDNGGTTSLESLGKPANRFGFSPSLASAPGRPKEFAADLATAATGNPLTFIGRYTLQECSDINFQYPQGLTSGGGIPTDPANYDLVLDTNSVVQQGGGNANDDFRQGLRRGEDLLLPNVHSFDVQVWDQAFGAFINIGEMNTTKADYCLANRNGFGVKPSSYGPRITENFGVGAINATFDTWHPQIGIDYDGDSTTPEPPPFRPVLYKPQFITGSSSDVPSWTANYNAQLSDTSFTPPKGYVFPSGTLPASTPFVYRCVVAGIGGTSEPIWPRVDGMTVTDGTAVWEAVENRKPLKAIKITIRFVDPSTQQMRQLTLIQSLVD